MSDYIDRTIKILTEKFTHPLIPLFFLFGVVLILLGIVNAIPLVKLEANSGFRYAAILLGVISLLAAIVIYYKPPKHSASNQAYNVLKDIDLELLSAKELILTRSWEEKRDSLTETQRKILNNFEILKRCNLKHVLQDFEHIPKYEMIYRLEQLCLLGFIDMINRGNSVTYQITTRYQNGYSKLQSMETKDALTEINERESVGTETIDQLN